jgi:hypothetical protein
METRSGESLFAMETGAYLSPIRESLRNTASHDPYWQTDIWIRIRIIANAREVIIETQFASSFSHFSWRIIFQLCLCKCRKIWAGFVLPQNWSRVLVGVHFRKRVWPNIHWVVCLRIWCWDQSHTWRGVWNVLIEINLISKRYLRD